MRISPIQNTPYRIQKITRKDNNMNRSFKETFENANNVNKNKKGGK